MIALALCACSLVISIVALVLVVTHNREIDRLKREHDGVLMPAARRATVTTPVPHRSPGPDEKPMRFVLRDAYGREVLTEREPG